MSETISNDAQTIKPSLGVNDLKACLQIIEICSQRGAFRAEELSGVGALYQKVMLFVQAAEAAAEQAAKAEEQTPKTDAVVQEEKPKAKVKK